MLRDEVRQSLTSPDHWDKMPGPLYARYVPPKKSAQTNQVTQPPPEPEAGSPKTQLYARYVPPKKSKPAVAETAAAVVEESRTPRDEVEPSSPAPGDVETNGSGKKRKRDDAEKAKRKEKKSKTRALKVATEEQSTTEEQEKGLDTLSFPQEDATADEQMQWGEADEAANDGAVDVDAILAKYSVSGGTGRKTQPTAPQTSTTQDGGEGDDNDAAAGAQAVFSKYRKSLTLSQKRQKKEEAKAGDDDKEKSPTPELHGLEPMPQPERVTAAPYEATFSSLPEWISNPRAVQSDAQLPFADLKLSKHLSDNLTKKTFTHAMAVQTAVLPLLLPGRANYKGDVCVSAPTGSGKTLSYVLPMIETLRDRATTRLRGLIVVPTRELVSQAREVAELCLPGTGVKIGTAVGSVALHTEQAHLVKRGQRYDPVARRALDEQANMRIKLGYDKDDDMLKDIVDLVPGHVPEYTSTVDILICTPGRLVDHIRSTPGFTVEHVEWLVIDEADRLLDSNFQSWVDVVLPALEPRSDDPRARLLAQASKARVVLKTVRKVILSATMTRDLSKLASLKLQRPTLVAVVDPPASKPLDGEVAEDESLSKNEHGTILPSTLKESAIPVGDGSEKPLHLLNLLLNYFDILNSSTEGEGKTALIFTSNDDNAARLARLLALLHPQLEPHTATLTKSTTQAERRSLLRSFSSTTSSDKRISILISTDRTSRGLDVPALSYVVNYDIPPGVTSYIHRVGRTARAGRVGEAWTLYTETEARWFWKTVARGRVINRGSRVVERVRLGEADEEMKGLYLEALGRLGEAVRGKT